MEQQKTGFGDRLRAARKRARISGEELGKGLGENGKDVTKASVSGWEHEKHYPKADQLRVICMKLDVSADDLLFGGRRVESTKLYQLRGALQGMTPEQIREILGPLAASPAAVAAAVAGNGGPAASPPPSAGGPAQAGDLFDSE